jgi:5,10-methylenetetrahydrofolate reductase
MKISEKMSASIAAGKKFFSFEYFPPRTDEVCQCLRPALAGPSG